MNIISKVKAINIKLQTVGLRIKLTSHNAVQQTLLKAQYIRCIVKQIPHVICFRLSLPT